MESAASIITKEARSPFTNNKAIEEPEEFDTLLEDKSVYDSGGLNIRRRKFKHDGDNIIGLRERTKAQLIAANADHLEKLENLARGCSAIKTMIITNESDSRSVQQQTIFAHSSSFNHTSSYSLLSESPFTKHMRELRPTDLDLLDNSWPYDPSLFSEDPSEKTLSQGK